MSIVLVKFKNKVIYITSFDNIELAKKSQKQLSNKYTVEII